MKVAQSCPTLCDPMVYNMPGSSVHGIFQTRILKWLATPFSKRSSQLRDQMESPIISNFLPKRASLYRSQLESHELYLHVHLPLHVPHVPQVAWSAHPQSWRMSVRVLDWGLRGSLHSSTNACAAFQGTDKYSFTSSK